MPRFGLRRYLNSFFNVVRANLDEYNLFGKTISLNEFTALMSNNSEKNFLVTNKRYRKGSTSAQYQLLQIADYIDQTPTNLHRFSYEDDVTCWVDIEDISTNSKMLEKVKIFDLVWHHLRTESEEYSFPCPSKTLTHNVFYKTQNKFTWEEAGLFISNRAAIRTPPPADQLSNKRKRKC